MRTFNCLFGLPCLLLGMVGPVGAAEPSPNPLHLRPHHITASVSDIDRAATWYQQMLGFQVRQRGKHGSMSFAELSVPGFGIALVQEPTAALASSGASSGPRWIHIVFTVPDPNSVYHLLQSRGASLNTRDDRTQGPVHSFTVTDSEGNEIEIVGDALP